MCQIDKCLPFICNKFRIFSDSPLGVTFSDKWALFSAQTTSGEKLSCEKSVRKIATLGWHWSSSVFSTSIVIAGEQLKQNDDDYRGGAIKTVMLMHIILTFFDSVLLVDLVDLWTPVNFQKENKNTGSLCSCTVCCGFGHSEQKRQKWSGR